MTVDDEVIAKRVRGNGLLVTRPVAFLRAGSSVLQIVVACLRFLPSRL